MRLIETAYVRLLQGLAAVAGVIMGATAVMIVFDVTVRNLGFQPPPHTLTFTEYGLLYVTMLGAPGLVRTKGHVYIELVTAAVGRRRQHLDRFSARRHGHPLLRHAALDFDGLHAARLRSYVRRIRPLLARLRFAAYRRSRHP